MRKINTSEITRKTAAALRKANYSLPPEIKNSFKKYSRMAVNSRERKFWELLRENARIAEKEKLPVCQDTGIVIAFVKIGCQVQLVGNIYEAINSGVRKAYLNNFFRKSVVGHPLNRKNSGDNSPATVHLEMVPGDKMEITFLLKGAGAENQSQLKMFSPAVGEDGLKTFVIEAVKKGGPCACPPLLVGVGLGGTFETVGILAKKALLRKVGSKNKDRKLQLLEKTWLAEINKTGIGLFGLKKGPTAVAVHIATAPCHIASLPAAINLQCHAIREITIRL